MLNKPYKERGYSETFERMSNERKIPFLSQYDITSYVEGISGELIQGGVIQSSDGKLKIDLENGTITWSDGVETTSVV